MLDKGKLERRMGIRDRRVLPALAIVVGILVIIFPAIIAYALGIYFIIWGILELV